MIYKIIYVLSVYLITIQITCFDFDLWLVTSTVLYGQLRDQVKKNTFLAEKCAKTVSGTRDFVEVFFLNIDIRHIYVFKTNKLRHGKWHSFSYQSVPLLSSKI